MNDIRFDTLEAARELKAAGLEEAHAEAIVATMGRAMSENLATKTDIKSIGQDIKALEQATRADIKALEQVTRADIKELEQAITSLERATKVDIKALEQATKGSRTGHRYQTHGPRTPGYGTARRADRGRRRIPRHPHQAVLTAAGKARRTRVELLDDISAWRRSLVQERDSRP